MTRNIFLRLDHDSIPSNDIQKILDSNAIVEIDAPENCFSFAFDELELDHAVALLSSKPERFGHDIRHYLRSASGFFKDVPHGFVSMPDAGPDFKKRFSEDLGVSIGALFMMKSFGIKCETIAHIPTNKTLKGLEKTPDFAGFDSENQKMVFECKGTTRPDQIDKFRHDAKVQLGNHTEPEVPKIALVTYIPVSTKLIPPYLFVSDPPIDPVNLTQVMCLGLHYILVCNFSGLEKTSAALRDFMAIRLSLKGITPDSRTYRKALTQYRPASENLLDTFSKDKNEKDNIFLEGRRFIGTWRTFKHGEKLVKVFTGVEEIQMSNVIDILSKLPEQDGSAIAILGNRESISVKDRYSLFSDASLFMVG